MNAHLRLSPDAPIDLHMHTTYSDGQLPANQVIDYLVQEGFEMVAVTDHDRVDKVAEIQQLGATRQLPILPGVEMSTQWRGYMAHLLCYGFDPRQNALQDLTEKTFRDQLRNTHDVYDHLIHQGYEFPRQDEVLTANNGNLHRPSDNISLLVEHGYAENRTVGLQMITEAGFQTMKADLAETIEAAHQSGAVCLIAHPGRRESGFTFFDPELLDQVRSEIPLDGIEVYHPYHSPETIEMYQDYVQRNHLLLSTGSDSHFNGSRMPIKHKAQISSELLNRLGVELS